MTENSAPAEFDWSTFDLRRASNELDYRGDVAIAMMDVFREAMRAAMLKVGDAAGEQADGPHASLLTQISIEGAIPGGHDPDCYQRDEAGEAIRATVAGLTDLLGDTIAPAITAIEQARADAEPVEPVASLRAHAYPGRF